MVTHIPYSVTHRLYIPSIILKFFVIVKLAGQWSGKGSAVGNGRDLKQFVQGPSAVEKANFVHIDGPMKQIRRDVYGALQMANNRTCKVVHNLGT